MCGIAGSTECADPWVGGALDAIEHRGPDGRGLTFVDNGTHGHVRLAIQDPNPRSDQPFVYGQTTLSYVGECWNWRALRERLEAEGREFRTEGDTEVVAAALDAWGWRALQQIEGMFALAWTDGRGETRLARDRFGKVPLYTLSSQDLFNQGVRWASERRAFGRDAAKALPVPPGAVLRVPDMQTRAYYLLDSRVAPNGRTPPERVRAHLEAGVEARLQADVPVCCLISGGLDSAAILALVKQRMPDVVAYVACCGGASEDLHAARAVAADLGVELREVHVPWPNEEDVVAAVNAIEIPMKAQVEIATLCLPLARAIQRDGFKVVLSGEGADEVFGGYGNTQRHAVSDAEWIAAREYQVAKMARGNFLRVNKVFMAHGVEARLPFLERPLVEYVLGLGLEDCPPKKRLLKEAVRDLVPDLAVTREKQTFQGSAGVTGYLDDLFAGQQIKVYNEMARDLFGGIPRG